MEIIQISFPARRYHATPWDAHVNEGRIEWPPSPLRIIRALLAVGYTKLGWVKGPSPSAQSAILKLSSAPPAYSLPKGTESHTRHYMPTKDKTAKVFDAFLRFNDPDAVLQILFDVEFTDAERSTLAELVGGLTYLGRAESWAEASLLDALASEKLAASGAWCKPNSRGDGRPVRLLMAMSQEAYIAWRTEQVTSAADTLEAAEREKAAARGRTLTAKAVTHARDKAQENYPGDILAALQLETSTWQSQGWPQPPGTQWIDYTVPGSLLGQEPLCTLPTASQPETVHALLLAIDGEGKRGTVRPLMKRALPLMELLHGESVRKATRELSSGNLPELTGRNHDGTVRRGHQHAHWLPLSLFGKGRIDHVLVWNSVPFSAQAIAALSSIRWAYSKGIDRLSVNLAGMGCIKEIERQLMSQPACKKQGLAPLQTGNVWESVTPLVLRKFVHKRGKKTPEGQIREELLERGFSDPVSVEVWSSTQMVENDLKGFVLKRKDGKQSPPFKASWGATIKFSTPQSGPVCLGYGSHFGLGVFGAVE
jgi:CRISPR-associated protein Csb2